MKKEDFNMKIKRKLVKVFFPKYFAMSEHQKRKLKQRIYHKLGAEQWQSVVFLVEKAKYLVIKKFFPNIKSTYEKQCNNAYLINQKKIKKNKITDNETKMTLLDIQKQKLAFRKELVREKNRNYHVDANHPTRFVEYLQWNKKVHVKSIIRNILMIIATIITTLVVKSPYPIFSITVITICTIGAIIDFECINLQNYNLCRFQDEKMKERLKRTEEEKLISNIEKLKSGSVPVAQAIGAQLDLPTIDDIVDQITTREQAKQLLIYLKEELTTLQKNQNQETVIQKKKGGI